MLNIVRGDTEDITVTMKDNDGNALDLTGATVWFTAKRHLNDSDAQAIIQKQVTSHTNAVAGETVISLTSGDTAKSGIYYYDIQVDFPGGAKRSTKVAKMEITEDVTKQ